MSCVPSEDSDQPGHLPSLIRVFAVRMKKAWVLSYPLITQGRLLLDWVDALADLSLYWAHLPFCRLCHALAHLNNHYNVKRNVKQILILSATEQDDLNLHSLNMLKDNFPLGNPLQTLGDLAVLWSETLIVCSDRWSDQRLHTWITELLLQWNSGEL